MYFADHSYKNTECTVPWTAIAPNILIDKNFSDYPFLNGTGFFCRFAGGSRYYYVTALHCLDGNGQNKEIEEFPLLKIAYKTSTRNHIISDDVIFESTISIGHAHEDKPGIYEDVLVYIVKSNLTATQEETLKRRSLVLKHPSWYKNFFEKTEAGARLFVIGYPKDSTTESEILNGKGKTQRRFLWGYHNNKAHYPDRKTLDNINWKGTELVGFSGAPVFIQKRRLLGIESIPIGVVLTGNSKKLEYLDMGRVADMLMHLENHGPTLACNAAFSYSY